MNNLSNFELSCKDIKNISLDKKRKILRETAKRKQKLNVILDKNHLKALNEHLCKS